MLLIGRTTHILTVLCYWRKMPTNKLIEYISKNLLYIFIIHCIYIKKSKNKTKSKNKQTNKIYNNLYINSLVKSKII